MASYEVIRQGKLTVLKTSPENVEPRAIHGNVGAGEIYGINGSFFDYATGDILSMAIVDNVPVKGNPGDYGGGWENAKYARGTLVYDRPLGGFMVQVVRTQSELKVSDHSAYWAQGGISMSLQDDAGWKAQAAAEHMPGRDSVTTRSGMAYNAAGDVLLVHSTACTGEEFRRQVKVAFPDVVDGIFLDCGGSAQERAYNIRTRGDGRTVYEMLALIDK